jgi:hypothetical protein
MFNRHFLVLVTAAMVFLASVGSSQAESNASACAGTQELSSPDGTLQARIIHIQGKTGCGESRVEIRNRAAELLQTASYTSDDGEHGWGVEKAAWTPNSGFFIFSMSSSGGHEAKHFPTFFYVRKTNNIETLEKFLRNVAVDDPEFQILPLDTIEISGWDISKQQDTIIRLELHKLMQ